MMSDHYSKTRRNNTVNVFSNESAKNSPHRYQLRPHGNTTPQINAGELRKSLRIQEWRSHAKGNNKSTHKLYPGSGRISRTRHSFRTPVQRVPLKANDGRTDVPASKSFVVGPNEWDIDTPRLNIEGLLAVAETQPRATHLRAEAHRESTPTVNRTFKASQASSHTRRQKMLPQTAQNIPTPDSKFTPRTNIWNLLHLVKGGEQMPAKRKEDVSEQKSTRSDMLASRPEGWGQEVSLSPMYLSRASEGKEDTLTFEKKSLKRPHRSFHIPFSPSKADTAESSISRKDENLVTAQKSAHHSRGEENVLFMDIPDQERSFNDNVNYTSSDQDPPIEGTPTSVGTLPAKVSFSGKSVQKSEESRRESHDMSSDTATEVEREEDVAESHDLLRQEESRAVLLSSSHHEIISQRDNVDFAEPLLDNEDIREDVNTSGHAKKEGTSAIFVSRRQNQTTMVSGNKSAHQKMLVSNDPEEDFENGESFPKGALGHAQVTEGLNDKIDKNSMQHQNMTGNRSILLASRREDKSPQDASNAEIINKNHDFSGSEQLNEIEQETDLQTNENETLLLVRNKRVPAAGPGQNVPTTAESPVTPSQNIYDLSEGSSSSGDMELFKQKSPKKSSVKKGRRSAMAHSQNNTPAANQSVPSTSKSRNNRSHLSPESVAAKKPRLSYTEWKSTKSPSLCAPRSSTPTDRSKRFLHSTKIQSSILSHLSQNPASASMEKSSVIPMPDISPIRPVTPWKGTEDLAVAQGSTVHEGNVNRHAKKTPADPESSVEDLPEGISPLVTPHLDMNKRPQPSTVQQPTAKKQIGVTSGFRASPAIGQNQEVKTKKGVRQPTKRNPKTPGTTLPRRSVKFFAERHTSIKLSKDAIEEIEKASEVFWADSFKTLEVYATHAGRKIVNEQDVILLMKTQRLIKGKEDLHDRIREFLPMEWRSELIPMATS